MSSWLPSPKSLIPTGSEFKRSLWDPIGAEKARADRLLTRPAGPAPVAPPPPVIEDAEARRQDEADRLRMRRGRAASILSTGAPGSASRVLLGG